LKKCTFEPPPLSGGSGIDTSQFNARKAGSTRETDPGCQDAKENAATDVRAHQKQLIRSSRWRK